MEQVNAAQAEKDHTIIEPLLRASAALDTKDLETFTAIGLLILATMETQTGTAILLCDPLGDGSAQLIAVGNPLLVQPLLGAAAEAAQTLEQMQPGGVH